MASVDDNKPSGKRSVALLFLAPGGDGSAYGGLRRMFVRALVRRVVMGLPACQFISFQHIVTTCSKHITDPSGSKWPVNNVVYLDPLWHRRIYPISGHVCAGG